MYTQAVLLFLGLLQVVSSVNILAIMPCASHSHHIWNSVITNELAKRGHNVTYFSPDNDKNPPPGLRQIQAEGVYDRLHSEVDIQGMVERQSPWQITQEFIDFGRSNCAAVVDSQGFDELLEVINKEDFELILFDITMTDCMLPVAEFFPNASLIGMTAYGGSDNINGFTGNPVSISTRAHTFLPFSGDMTLWERLHNLAVHTYTYLKRFYIFMPEQLGIAQQKLPHVKDLQGVVDRFSLVLANNHYSFDPPTPAVPALIHVGGVHIKPPKPLSKDVQTFLDEAKAGAIFFALGTNVQSSMLSPDRLQILLNVFEKLKPVRIIWKFEAELENKPNNVLISKWLPQNDILAHKNIKLFFTHSGLLSTQEALYHGKPVVGMPFLADQFINIVRSVKNGIGEKIDYNELNEEHLYDTIKNVLENPKYREKAEEISKVFRDQKETPLERSMFWIEYVIRHKGAKHLRSPTLNLTWYENELLDIKLPLLAAILLLVYIVQKLIRLVMLSKAQEKPPNKTKVN